jgi:hypothetical protein
MANKGRNKTDVFTLCLALTFSMIAFCEHPIVSGQTTVKSSAEQRSRRIEEHQQLRRSSMELMQDLRAIHLMPEQRQEIRQLFRRYFTRTGTGRPDPTNENAAQSPSENSASAAPPQAAERLRTEVTALLTSEQSDKLNSLRQEREERRQKNPDFQIRKKP